MRIGIDTGGTYTDAVLVTDRSATATERVVASAKARTRTDLSVGIAEALDEVLSSPDAPTDPATDISMVSLSTTLATNALVEGVGGRVALVFIGFGQSELDRGGLREALGEAPIILADGGHDSLGAEVAPLDTGAIAAHAATLDVDAFAVAGQFSVRNPAHELAARDALIGLGKPVACGHELSARLNGPKRALTCLLNARLIGLIAELCLAAEVILDRRGITAPLMIVRGDGSLVSAEFAKNRPIETILSGPAASLIGAGFLTGEATTVVADIGGTTTDVGILRGGRPTVSAAGAMVGGHRTMVEAVDMSTHGLGGDSEIELDPRSPDRALLIGPRRITPLCLLADEVPDIVHRTLDSRELPYRSHSTTFATATGRSGPTNQREQRILDLAADGWRPVGQLAKTSLEQSALRALVGRSLIRLAGFTPTDAAHVLSLHDRWDKTASEKAAELMATASAETGNPVRPNGKAFATWVLETLTRRSAEAVLATTLTADGFPPDTVDSALTHRALDGHSGMTSITVRPSIPVVGLGASAATYYPGVAGLLGADHLIPEHAGVANAIGAAVGRVRIAGQATVSQPSRGQFRIHLPDAGNDLGNLEPAIDKAIELLSDRVRGETLAAGANSVELEASVDRKTATVAGKPVFVEATITVVGSGSPGRPV